MKQLLATLFSLVVVFSSYSQTKTIQAATTKGIQQIEKKVDSVNAVLNTSFDKYKAKVDSINNAKLMEALKNSNELQNGNNTYYSWLIGFITAIITAMAIVFTINFFGASAAHKKELLEQRKEFTDELTTQAELFDNIITDQQTTFNALVKQFETLSDQIKKSNADFTAEAQDKLKNFDERLKGIKDGGDTVEALKKEFEGVKDTVNRISKKDVPPTPLADLTGIGNYLGQKRSGKNSKLIDMIMKDSELTCPHCGEKFNRILATRIKDIPLTFKCPNLFCQKEVKAPNTLFDKG